MRGVLLFSFLAFGFVGYGQIIDFPDANFKNALVNSLCVDTDGNGSPDADADFNNDGEIDVDEALNIRFLDISNRDVVDIEGINFFNSLSKLDCSYNKIDKVIIDKLNSLTDLDCSQNIFSEILIISNLPKLSKLKINGMSVNSIELKNLPLINCINITASTNLKTLIIKDIPKLQELICNNVGLDSLIINDFPELEFLNCSASLSVQALKLKNLPKLSSLICFGLGIKSLELNNFPELTTLNCNNNFYLSSVTLNSLPKLSSINCSLTDLNTLVLKDLPELTTVKCNSNISLTNLNFKNLPKLSSLICYNTGLISLELRDFLNLTKLDCYNNNSLLTLSLDNLPILQYAPLDNSGLISIYMKDLPELTTVSCDNNKSLRTLSLITVPKLNYLACSKTDLNSISVISECNLINLTFNSNPNLKYICVSENNFPLIDSLLNLYGYSNVNVTNYCSFDPFSEFGVIKGEVVLDADNNGCDNNDKNLSTVKFDIVGPSKSGTFVLAGIEKYDIPMVVGTNTITPKLENQAFTFSPEFITIEIQKGDTITQDFCITPKGIFRQTNITVIPLSPPARPGFEAKYKIVWENVGNQIESGTLNFTYEETILDYFSVTQTEDLKSDGIVSWYFNNLLPFEKREITVTLKVNRPTDTPAVNAGDKLYLTASILDNIFTLENTVVGSYDPNDKTCLQGDRVKPDMVGEYVDYLIRFENTGNYAAENVVVKDIIDTKTFDVSTLKITDASHEVYTRIEGNKVEFIFENIQLPFDDANNDGYIAFKIKTLPSLVFGDSLKNLADIYFDYNFPIRTNEARTTVAFPVFTKDITTEVNIYPNPVTDI
ncbi:MAG TPA: hypothetical protein PKD51_15315, partial [Saprospiraceae bacterium]|nr:hypothetical protein [Saprospiraceae bacterium]